ncbi:MAG: SDR family NAD(P)-dependent oxidoreductase [Candidatus Hodarchaeota archaeon]
MKFFKEWKDPGIAVITGASSGFGAEYGRQLAREGFDTLLVARREEKLEEVKDELDKIGGKHEILVADLSMENDIGKLEEKIRSLDNLDLLINNAGFATLKPFQDVEMTQQLEMLALHTVAPVKLTRAAIDVMIKRKRGIIINVSSMGIFSWSPNSVLYNSTKAFQRVFSETLSLDLKGTGIKVQALCPGFTHTGIHYVRDFKKFGFDKSALPDEWWMDADTVVKGSLDALQTNLVTYIPGEINRKRYRMYLDRDEKTYQKMLKNAEKLGTL